MAPSRPHARWAEVVRLYQELRSIRRTSEACGLSKRGVEHVLKTLNVSRFPRNRSGTENSQYKAMKPGSKQALVRNEVVMKHLYIEEKKSLPSIAQELGVSPQAVLAGLKYLGIERRTISQSLRGVPRPGSCGAKHRDWQGGISGWRRLARKRLNQTFVRPVMERDNFCCRWCGSLMNLVVHHHKRPFKTIVRLVLSRLSRNPDLMLFVDAITAEHTLEDGLTLCKPCHDGHHKKHGK